MGDLNVIFWSPYGLLSGQLFPVLTWLAKEWGVFCILYVHSFQRRCYGREHELVASETMINENLYMSHYKSINNTDINGPALPPQSLPRHSVIDILVSSSDSRCPFYIRMPSIISSHLLMSSGLALKSTHKTKHSSRCCCFFFFNFSTQHTLKSQQCRNFNFARQLGLGKNASGCPPDLCQCVTAGIWQRSTSTSLSLCLRPQPAWPCTREAS